MKINNYNHLPYSDKIAMIKLLIFIEGQEALRRFEAIIKEILK